VHPDFCNWRGVLVLGSDNASYEGGGNLQCAEPHSGLWFGKTDDLWQFGKPKGWGGPWWDTAVTAGAPSDPYLMTGFDGKCLHLSHDADTTVNFAIQVDACGDAHYGTWKTVAVAAGGYEVVTFPPGCGSSPIATATPPRSCTTPGPLTSHFPLLLQEKMSKPERLRPSR
jgi:hypothetical protein